MSIPTGYEKLAVIGIAWKNEYVQGTAYKTMNAVYYNGSTYVALRDNPTGPPAADGANWQYLAKGFEQQLLSAITALDTSGVLGQAGASVGGQALMDAIADKVMTKLVERSSIVQTESTDPTTVPSSPYFKQVTDRVISDLAYFARSDIAYNDYVTKLGWSNIITGSEQFCMISIATTAAKVIPANTIIGTLPFNVVENSVPVLYQDSYIIAYGKNLRIEKEIASGTTILAYIPTRILK